MGNGLRLRSLMICSGGLLAPRFGAMERGQEQPLTAVEIPQGLLSGRLSSPRAVVQNSPTSADGSI